MLVVSAVHIVVGWVWHTAYRARWHWRLKREGALLAAAAVAAFGAVDSARSMMRSLSAPQAVIASTAPAVTASATPVVTEPKVVEVAPAPTPFAAFPSEPIQTTAAVSSPDLDNVAPEDRLPPEADDPIAAKINERLGDPATTASIPVAKPKPKPVKVVKPVAVKPVPQKVAERSETSADAPAEPVKPKAAKSAKSPATKPVMASTSIVERPDVAKLAPIKRTAPKKPKPNESQE